VVETLALVLAGAVAVVLALAAAADGATLSYRLELNGVPLASGERTGPWADPCRSPGHRARESGPKGSTRRPGHTAHMRAYIVRGWSP
jgi:hypothetical protein